jgi:hypothetical protein
MRRGLLESIVATGTNKVSIEKRDLIGEHAYVVCHDRQMGEIAESDDARQRDGTLLQHFQGDHAVFFSSTLSEDKECCENASKHQEKDYPPIRSCMDSSTPLQRQYQC